MPRRKQETPNAIQTAGPFLVDPHGIYRPAHIRAGLGLAKTTLAREMREKRLRFGMRGGKVFVLGRWLISWIESSEVQRRPRAARALQADAESAAVQADDLCHGRAS